jgi:hypothetical protein
METRHEPREDVLPAHGSLPASDRESPRLPKLGHSMMRQQPADPATTQRDRQSGADIAVEWLVGAPAGMSLKPGKFQHGLA